MEGISKKIYLELTEPTEEDNRSGQKRILDALKEQGTDCEMTLDVMRKLYPLCEQAEWKLTASLSWDGKQWMIVEIEPGNTENSILQEIHQGCVVQVRHVQSQQQGTMTTYRAGKEHYLFEKLHCYH